MRLLAREQSRWSGERRNFCTKTLKDEQSESLEGCPELQTRSTIRLSPGAYGAALFLPMPNRVVLVRLKNCSLLNSRSVLPTVRGVSPLCPVAIRKPFKPHIGGITRHHEVGFYSEERYFLDQVTRFIATALKAGNSAIVVATESHRESLLVELQADGLDMVQLLRRADISR